tara:strand:+ start:90 stop:1025 length:936 start_codon:yes stop_codon:yes gene_type:complete
VTKLTELHCHLDGSVRPETITRLARRHNIELPGSPELLARAPERCNTLERYISAIDIALMVLQTPDALYEAAYELVEDWQRDNVAHGEMRFAPRLHARRGLTFEEILDAVTAGLRDATRSTGVGTALIACAMRNDTPGHTEEVVEAAVRHPAVVGVDIAGPQIGFPLAPHAPAVRAAREAGLRVTIHAGETDSAQDIWVAIDELGAERIGHGVKAIEDMSLIERLRRDQVALEMCPTSNVQTGAVASLAAHPIDELLLLGVPVTVSTDARTVSSTTLSGEYAALRHAFLWTDKTWKSIQAHAARAAFADVP